MFIGEQLFDLIQKMGRGERRAFKVYVNKYSNKKNHKMLVFFEIIRKMKQYDEALLIKQLERKNISFPNLSYEKFRLKNLILNALTDLHHNRSDHLSIGDIINKIELGFQYDAPDIVKEWIDKGYEYAKVNFNKEVKLVIQKYELDYLNSIRAHPEKRVEISKQMYTESKVLVNTYSYQQMKDQFFAWYFTYFSNPSEEAQEMLHQLIQLDLFKAPDTHLNNRQKDHLYLCKIMYYSHIKDYENLILYNKKLLANFKQYPFSTRYTFSNYLGRYNNLFLAYFKAKKLDNAAQTIKELQDIANTKKLQPTELNELNVSLHYLKILLYYEQKEFTQLYELAPQIKHLLETQPNIYHFQNFDTLIKAMTATCFYLQKYEESLEWIEIDYSLSTSYPNTPPEIATIKLMEYCNHICLHNFFRLDGIKSSLRYYISRHNLDMTPYNRLFKILYKTYSTTELLLPNDLEYIDTFIKNHGFTFQLSVIQMWLQQCYEEQSIK